MTHRSLERSPQDTRDGFHLYSAQASFAFPARRSGPATLTQEVSTIFGLYPSSLARSAGFFSLAGKASSVSISGTFLFLWDRVFIYRCHLVPHTLCSSRKISIPLPPRRATDIPRGEGSKRMQFPRGWGWPLEVFSRRSE